MRPKRKTRGKQASLIPHMLAGRVASLRPLCASDRAISVRWRNDAALRLGKVSLAQQAQQLQKRDHRACERGENRNGFDHPVSLERRDSPLRAFLECRRSR